MEFVVFVLVLMMPALALAAVLAPPIAMALSRRRLVLAAPLYLATLGQLAAWIATANAHMDWADRTGGPGDALVGIGLLLGAVLTAACATAVTAIRSRTVPHA